MKILENFKKVDWFGTTSRRIYLASAFITAGIFWFAEGRYMYRRYRTRTISAQAKEVFELKYPELKDKYVDPRTKRLP